MPKFKPLIFILFLMPCLSLFSAPLPNALLSSTVTGNSFSGHCSDTDRAFTLYFAPEGTVYINKAGSSGYTRYGTWKIKGNLLITPWPVRDLETSSNQRFSFYTERDLKVYKLQFNPILDKTYEPYRVKTCSCEIFTPGPFPKCTWIQGKANI